MLYLQYRTAVAATLSSQRGGPPACSQRDTSPIVLSAELDERRKWLSRLLAVDAAKDKDVLVFRDEVLGGKLLLWEEVQNWMQQQVRTEEPSYHRPDTRVQGQKPRIIPPSTLSPAAMAEITQGIKGIFSGGDREIRYLTPNGKVSSVLVGKSYNLRSLSSISARLAKYYQWSWESVPVFVLTDRPPDPLPSTLRILPHPKYPALDRLIVESYVINAAQDIKNLLPRARQAYQKSEAEETKERYRQLNKKYLRLAVFSCRHEDKTVAERLKLWNEEIGADHPTWKYDEADTWNFGKQAKKAVKDLLGEV